MPINLSPVVLFVYNRPWHTEQTLRALQQNDLAAQTELYIYADGPKPYAEKEQLQKIQQVRELIRREQWCGTVHIIESASNKGLADSVIAGVTEVVNRHDRVIVLEDDIVPSKGFLRYMNDALELYKDEEKVMHISGYIYPYKCKDIVSDTLFLKIYSCWGWGTWSRAWRYFEPDVNVHLQHYSTKEDIRNFNINGHMPNYWQLLANQTGEIYTWAVKWYASWLYNGGIALFPSLPLIKNIGITGEGTHNNNSNFDPFNWLCITSLSLDKKEILENLKIRYEIDTFFKNMYKPQNRVRKLLVAIINSLYKIKLWKK